MAAKQGSWQDKSGRGNGDDLGRREVKEGVWRQPGRHLVGVSGSGGVEYQVAMKTKETCSATLRSDLL